MYTGKYGRVKHKNTTQTKLNFFYRFVTYKIGRKKTNQADSITKITIYTNKLSSKQFHIPIFYRVVRGMVLSVGMKKRNKSKHNKSSSN